MYRTRYLDTVLRYEAWQNLGSKKWRQASAPKRTLDSSLVTGEAADLANAAHAARSLENARAAVASRARLPTGLEKIKGFDSTGKGVKIAKYKELKYETADKLAALASEVGGVARLARQLEDAAKKAGDTRARGPRFAQQAANVVKAAGDALVKAGKERPGPAAAALGGAGAAAAPPAAAFFGPPPGAQAASSAGSESIGHGAQAGGGGGGGSAAAAAPAAAAAGPDRGEFSDSDSGFEGAAGARHGGRRWPKRRPRSGRSERRWRWQRADGRRQRGRRRQRRRRVASWECWRRRRR